MSIYDDSSLAPAGYTTLCALPSYTVFDVKADYGAVGDGTTDDTVAIRNAIAAAHAAGSGIIYFPAGTYAVCPQSGDGSPLPGFSRSIFNIAGMSNLVFLGAGVAPTSKITAKYDNLQDPVTHWTNTGDPDSRICRYDLFTLFNDSATTNNIQWRSLDIDGNAGYTGDSTVGGSMKAVSATINAAGTGYAINDVLTLSGPTPVGAGLAPGVATFRVTTVNGSGGVTAVTMVTPGSYTFITSSAIPTTGGGGTGCTLLVTATPTGDGWDEGHKCMELNGPGIVSNILIFNCVLHHWRGEVVYAGGTTIQAVNIVNGQVYSSNASSVSCSANITLVDVMIGPDVYNGLENFNFGTGQQTTLKGCTIQCGSSTVHGNGLALLSNPGNTATVDHCHFINCANGFLFSEVGHNITSTNNTFTNCGHAHVLSIVGSYPGNPTGFTNLTIDHNVFDLSSTGSAGFLTQHNAVPNLVISNNTVLNGALLGGEFPLGMSGFIISNNTLGPSTIGSFDAQFGDVPASFAIWSHTTRIGTTGSGVLGTTTAKIDDFSAGPSRQIRPFSDLTWLNANGTTGNFSIPLDPAVIGAYPINYFTVFRVITPNPGGGTDNNWYMPNDGSWNTWSSPLHITDGTTIGVNSDGLFEVAAAPSFTSANNTTFQLGVAGTFTVVVTSNPVSTITLTGGVLPAGLTFVNGVLSGTATDDDGVTTLTFSADNGNAVVTQTFTLTLLGAPPPHADRDANSIVKFIQGASATVNTTVKCYGDVGGALAYFSNKLSGLKWIKSTPLKQQLALCEATTLIDRLNFLGEKAVTTQFLQFPRGVDTVVPDDIIFATYDLALRLIQGIDVDTEIENLQVQQRQYAGTSVAYNRSSVPENVLAGIPSAKAWARLRPYLRDPNEIRLSRV